ncbi:MAG: ComEC/Rec2 family competence protein, partial [Acidobacteriota bacterium]
MRSLPHRQPFAAHPLALLAVAFACGIPCGPFISVHPILLVLCALSATAAFLLLLREKTLPATMLLSVAFLFTGAILAGIEQHNVRADSLKLLLDDGTIAVGDPIELTGVLEAQPEPAPESFHLVLRVERLKFRDAERTTSGIVTLLLPVARTRIAAYQSLELRYGARIRVMTALKREDNFRNPGVSSFTEYLDRKGYDATGVVKSLSLIERLDDERVFLPLAWLYEWRERLQEQINCQFAHETASVLNASLLGNRYFLSRPTSERFRAGGTFHVLVISGLHISFIGGVVLLIARRLTKRKGWQFLLSATALWGYALAVGAEASVVRAALMFTLIAFAPVIARHSGSLNALGATALALLARRPSDLFDPSFQLTFVSVLAIVVLAWPLLQRLTDIGSWRPTREQPYPPTCSPWLRSLAEVLFWSERKWARELAGLSYDYRLFKAPLAANLERYHLQAFLRYAFAAFVVSACVQLALLPFLILYFHRLSVSALLLNVGVSVLMAALTFAAIAGMLLALLNHTLAAPLIKLTNALDWLMVHSVDPFARFGVASLRLPEYSGWAVAIYGLFFLPLLIIALALAKWNPLRNALRRPGDSSQTGRRGGSVVRVAVALQFVAVIIVTTHPHSASHADGRLRLDFLDVGQGDAALVTMPDGTTLLVDGGGRPTFLNREKDKREVDDSEAESFEPDARSIG